MNDSDNTGKKRIQERRGDGAEVSLYAKAKPHTGAQGKEGLPNSHSQPNIYCSNKSFRVPMKEPTLKANKGAHLSEATHWYQWTEFGPQICFIWLVQFKKLETAFEN